MAYPKFVEKGESITATWANDVVSSIRRRPYRRKRGAFNGGGSGDSAELCSFGEIIALSGSNYALMGGLVTCGDKNFNVPDEEIETESATVSLISIKLEGITFNADDDEQFIMPGIKTATSDPEFDFVTWTEGTDYPDNINPASVTGTGTIYVPLGKLTTFASASATPTFEAAECGNITVKQCGGILFYTRS